MKIQSINNNQASSFRALHISTEARAILSKEKGGAQKVEKYLKECADFKTNMTIEALRGDDIIPYLGSLNQGCGWPNDIKGNIIRITSGEVYGEDFIDDYLKFSSAERAKEVYDGLKKLANPSAKPLEKLDWAVAELKAFEEGENLPLTYDITKKFYK